MSKLFTCDNCGKTFPNALDEEQYEDEHGILHGFDICAPCKGKLNKALEEPQKRFFEPLVRKKK